MEIKVQDAGSLLLLCSWVGGNLLVSDCVCADYVIR